MIKLCTTRQVARLLNVPHRWLTEQAKAGVVPALRIGRRLLLDPDAVGEALTEQARAGGGKAKR